MESELNIKENNNSNIILLKNKNPNFRNQKILIDNYSYFKNPSFGLIMNIIHVHALTYIH